MVNCRIVEADAVRHAPILGSLRSVLVAFAVLTALAVAALYIRPETTDRYFAWTIAPPLTAAFLGGAYAAGCTLVVLSLRAAVWTHARAAIVAILVFTVLTLLATLAHLDRFHFGVSRIAARSAAWFWLAIYILVPVILVVLLVRQLRASARTPAPRMRPLPRWLAGLLAIEGAALFAVGVVLFVRPGLLTAWPWPLTPLTSRAVGAWLISFGVAAAGAVLENDLTRLRAPAVAYLVFAVAELLVVVRYRSTFAWDAAPAWVYLAFLGLVALTAGVGVRLSRGAVPVATRPVPQEVP